MFLQSMLPIWGNFIAAYLLNALTTVPGAKAIVTGEIHLFTATSGPITRASLPAQFTEAAFTGYAAVATTGGGSIVNLPSGDGQGIINTANFVCTTTGAGESILGYWVQDAAGNLILAELFANPVPIVNSGDFVSLDVIYAFPNSVQCE